MKAVVFGAGMMGRAIAYDLARTAGMDQVVLGDISLKAARDAARWAGGDSVSAAKVDAGSAESVRGLLGRKFDVAVGAASFRFNELLAREAIRASTCFCDLGGNNSVVERELSMDGIARAAGVAVVPDCGLAPGMVQPVAARALELVGGEADELKIRVGGLPVHPKPPLNYKLVFSPEGLINEYDEPAVALREGRRVELEPLTEIEALDFPPPFGRLEAFVTSGGSSTLPWTMEGRVRELDYKTIRYPGHCAAMKGMLWLGLGGTAPVKAGGAMTVPRELLVELLRRKLTDNDQDVVLVRVTALKDGKGTRFQLVDYGEPGKGISAMMKTTAFPASAVAWMLASGRIEKRGALPQERCVPPADFIAQLERRGIWLSRTSISGPGQ